METIDNRTFKEKFEDFKGRIAQKFKDLKQWISEHFYEILTAVVFVGPVILSVLKEVNKARAASLQARREQREIYDPRKGRYYTLRRTPKAWEWEEIDERYEAGENYSSILRDMRLI